jgi:hypothetical protein
VLSGLIVLVLGIWAGLVPFIGPYFHYSFGSNATWHYTANRFWLDILPAIAVVIGSLVLLRSANRISGVVGSWLAIAGGAWLAVGPAVSRVWEHGPGPIGGPLYGSARQTLELVGYFYGVGVLIAALSAFALGRFVSRPALAVAEPVAATAYAEPVAQPQPVAQREPVTESQPVAPPERAAEFDPVREPVAASDRRHTTADRRRTGSGATPSHHVESDDVEDDEYAIQPGVAEDSTAPRHAARH